MRRMNLGCLIGLALMTVGCVGITGGLGAECSANDECGSNLCLRSDTNDYCTEACSSDCDCPSGFACAASGSGLGVCAYSATNSCSSSEPPPGTPPGGEPPPSTPPPSTPPSARPVSELVVGAWTGSARCRTGSGEAVDVGYSWYVCPNRRIRGGSVMEMEGASRFEFLDTGSYTVSTSTGTMSVSGTSTVVNPSIIRGDRESLSSRLAYDDGSDTLTFETGCPVQLTRLAGGGPDDISAAECE